MKTLLKKSAILKTISSKIGAHLHKIDSVPQEDDSDFDDEEWMDHPTKPSLLLPTPSLICCSPLHTAYPEQ